MEEKAGFPWAVFVRVRVLFRKKRINEKLHF